MVGEVSTILNVTAVMSGVEALLAFMNITLRFNFYESDIMQVVVLTSVLTTN